jgi:hypothetical protein
MDNKSVFRTQKGSHFALNRSMINDTNLSLQAKGLMAIFLSNVDSWKFYMSEIQKRSKNGKDAHYNAIKELIKHGYIKKETQRNKKGQITGHHYLVFENPNLNENKPLSEKPDLANQDLANPHLINNNNNSINNNKGAKDSLFEIDENNDWRNALANKIYKLLKTTDSLKRSKLSTYVKLIWDLAKYYDKKELIVVFSWYVKNYNNEYVPKIYNTKHLKDKYPRIKDAMLRDNPHAFLVLSKETKKIIKMFDNQSIISEHELGGFIQASINKYKDFLQIHKSLINIDKGFLTYLSSYLILDVEQFIIEWTTRVLNIVKINPKKLNQYIFNHTLIDSEGRNLSVRYSGSSDLWEKYIKLVESKQG